MKQTKSVVLQRPRTSDVSRETKLMLRELAVRERDHHEKQEPSLRRGKEINEASVQVKQRLSSDAT
jgi:hypothetical protein